MMTKIPKKDKDIIEKAIYLPMVLSVLERDLNMINHCPFKLKEPYIHLIESTIKSIQLELAEVKKYMKNNKIKVYKLKRDRSFTMYAFFYKGYEEHHNYFNPRIRNKVRELMDEYFSLYTKKAD